MPSRRPGPAIALAAALVAATLAAACDSQADVEAFATAASLEPAGYTRTDANGIVLEDDQDDWRISPLFLGRVRVDPVWPNPTPGTVVTVPVSVLEFDAVRGGLVLRARDTAGRLSILDEIPDATSPGAYVFQFTPALLARTGLVRLFILDRFGELISYGDLQVE